MYFRISIYYLTELVYYVFYNLVNEKFSFQFYDIIIIIIITTKFSMTLNHQGCKTNTKKKFINKNSP